jgi:hypothetical protein
MTAFIKQGSIRVEDNEREQIGEIIYTCPLWADIADTQIPKKGDVWPYDEAHPYLKCRRITAVSDEAWGAEVSLFFSTESKYGDDFVEESLEIEAEVLDTTKTCKWDTAGTTCDIPVSTIYPKLVWVMSMKRATSTVDAIKQAEGKLNDRTFRGFPAETLLLESASVHHQWDDNGVLTGVDVSYRFVQRFRSHNEVWREARQKLVNGVPQYYQTADNTKPNYNPDPNMDSEPVYVDGPAGTPGWDKPYYMDGETKKYRYDTCDFATLLGIPGVLE